MLYKLHLLKYKNYYNRQVKRLKTLQEYSEYETTNPITDVNFKPNDWIKTSHILNINETQIPNYILVEAEDGSFTRWFVMESQRLRDNQYRLQLYRDVICDHLTDILNSDTFVEKGYINGLNNPLLYNKEDVTTNQIKVKEVPIYDKTHTPWLVAYLPKDLESKTKTYNLHYVCDYITEDTQSIAIDFPYYVYAVRKHTTIVNEENDSNYTKYSDYQKVLAEEGKIIKIGDIIHQIHVRSIRTYDLDNKDKITFIIKLLKIGKGVLKEGQILTPDNEKIYTIEASILLSSTIPFPKDCAYKIIAVPFSDDYFPKNILLGLFRGLGEISGNTLFDIQILPYSPTQLDPISSINYNSEFYLQEGDIYGTFNFNDIEINPLRTAGYDYLRVGDLEDEDVFYIHIQAATTNTFTFETTTRFMIDEHKLKTPEDVKLYSQLDIYRLNSPNFNDIFEFNASAMGVRTNDNNVFTNQKFNVDVTYKPYQPYIHITPIFDGIYGSDFDDVRGLICSGEFSIEQTSSAWENYKMQNKNYQQIFNRQIENMYVNQQINNVTNTVGSIAGVVGAGAKTGVAGAVASGVAGIADQALGVASYAENLDYAYDMHRFQLQNIKAIPRSLAKGTSYNINSRYVPFVEAYTCTRTEETALENKIKYNGMKVEIIGKLKDYINNEEDSETYVKGKIIRFDLNEDYNYLETVASEINKGFFVKPEDLDIEGN